MTDQPEYTQAPTKLYGHKIVDSVTGIFECWSYTQEDADTVEEKFETLDSFKQVDKSVLYTLQGSYSDRDDALVDKYDIEKHDEVGYRLGMLAVKMVSEGYDAEMVADRLRKNAELFENGGRE